jgi:site-specific recombinase XerD
MKGCRPLTDAEITEVLQSFAGRYALRDKALFVLGMRSGFRISELLSLRVQDVYQHGRMADYVMVARRHMKKKTESCGVPLHPQAKEALAAWLTVLEGYLQGEFKLDTPLFCSRVRAPDGSRRSISREQAWRILKTIYQDCELPGPLATHTLRKTFALKMWLGLDRDILRVQRALGHRNLNSTICYLSFKDEEVWQAILSAA